MSYTACSVMAEKTFVPCFSASYPVSKTVNGTKPSPRGIVRNSEVRQENTASTKESGLAAISAAVASKGYFVGFVVICFVFLRYGITELSGRQFFLVAKCANQIFNITIIIPPGINRIQFFRN